MILQKKMNYRLEEIEIKNLDYLGIVAEIREIRTNLQARKKKKKNQLNKATERPTLRWIFQCTHQIIISS